MNETIMQWIVGILGAVVCGETIYILKLAFSRARERAENRRASADQTQEKLDKIERQLAENAALREENAVLRDIAFELYERNKRLTAALPVHTKPK